MAEGIDAIILAGTKKCPTFGDTLEYKPFLHLGGKALVEYVIDAAFECPAIRRVYVATDTYRLNSMLTQRGLGKSSKIEVVPDYGSLTENILGTFSEHVLPDSGFDAFDYKNRSLESYLKENPAAEKRIVVLYSDSPFLRSEDISRFIETSDPDADYVIGFSHEEALREVEAYVGQELCVPAIKAELFPFEGTKIRANNLLMGKPLKMPAECWRLAQDIYKNRNLLGPKGEHNEKRWRNQVKIGLKYVMNSSSRKATIVRGFFSSLVRFLALRRARSRGGASMWLNKPGCEKAIYMISGNRTKGSMNICDVAVPTFDVDIDVFYKMLKADGEKLFHKLLSVPREYHKRKMPSFADIVEENPLLLLENPKDLDNLSDKYFKWLQSADQDEEEYIAEMKSAG
jgi:molybdopterin-guanine dinucleotide biosynthesis protein A